MGQAHRNASHGRVPYDGVQAFWKAAAFGAKGELRLEDLPFEPGQSVEVLAVSKTAGSATAAGRSLLGSVLEFHNPLEPVAGDGL
jgi:hypothetical protein